MHAIIKILFSQTFHILDDKTSLWEYGESIFGTADCERLVKFVQVVHREIGGFDYG